MSCSGWATPDHRLEARETLRMAGEKRREEGGVMVEALGMLVAKGGRNTDTILWIIAAVLVIAGVVSLFRGAVIAGIVLIVLGLLVGPGGVSIFK